MKRRVAIFDGTGVVREIEEPVPELRDNQVLIKVVASLISPGTEMGSVKRLRDEPDPNRKPTVFGYANAGEIIETRGDCKDLRVGMRVAAMGGAAAVHGTHAVVPVNLAIPIPDQITFEQATYGCLAATALQGVRRAEPTLGEYGIVLGQGIVGNLTAQFCQLSGARVIAWEAFESRIAIAKSCGIGAVVNVKTSDVVKETEAFCAPYGADFAVMAFGGEAQKAYDDAKACMKLSADGHRMGRVVLVGGCQVKIVGGAGTGNLDIRSAARTGPGYHDKAYELGQDYPNGFVQFTTQRNLREIAMLMMENRLRVDPMTTHRFALSDVGEAADLLVDHPEKALGVILEMED